MGPVSHQRWATPRAVVWPRARHSACNAFPSPASSASRSGHFLSVKKLSAPQPVVCFLCSWKPGVDKHSFVSGRQWQPYYNTATKNGSPAPVLSGPSAGHSRPGPERKDTVQEPGGCPGSCTLAEGQCHSDPLQEGHELPALGGAPILVYLIFSPRSQSPGSYTPSSGLLGGRSPTEDKLCCGRESPRASLHLLCFSTLSLSRACALTSASSCQPAGRWLPSGWEWLKRRSPR